MSVTEAQVLDKLRAVEDPDLHRDIVSLGFVKNVKTEDGAVAFDIDLTTPACPVRDQMEATARALVKEIPGVRDVAIRVTSTARGMGVSNLGDNLKGVRSILAVASGKGGVGKSTVAVNLALAVAKAGAKVGILDADVYGPSVPAMLGLAASPEAVQGPQAGKLRPLERFGLKVMSMGLLTTKDTPIVWRGPMATKLVQEFLGTVDWGDLDYLFVDLPPGTGDIQLTLAQSVPLSGAVIVTTPQDVAAHVAERGAQLFPKLNVPILGIVENMSHYVCPDCGHEAHIFQRGGGARAAETLGAPLLGGVPLQEAVAASGDQGVPIVAGDGASPAAKAYAEIAQRLVRRVSTVQFQLRAAEKAQPKEYKALDGGRLQTTWSDGHVGAHALRELRAQCPCAHCVDEWTGKRRIRIEDVAAQVSITGAEPVGRYATRFTWSDGHSTGLYTFARLRATCECPACAAGRQGTPARTLPAAA